MKISDDYEMATNEKNLAKIINAFMSFSATINVKASSQKISEYTRKFCSIFSEKKVYAEILEALIIMSLKKEEIKLDECMKLWGDLLEKINAEIYSSDEYSFLNYFADVAKVKYLYACYSDIAGHTTEIRKYADELKSTKEDYNRIEHMFSEPD